MRQFILPDLGEGLEEAEIVTWHVNEGDRVVVRENHTNHVASHCSS